MSVITPPAIDAAALDRLVDGELDEAARADLLQALDRHADGWKLCALAFLEAQAWRDAARAVPVTAAPAAPQPHPAGRVVRQLVAVAAVVAVAFCAGFVARGNQSGGQFALQNGSGERPAEMTAPARPASEAGEAPPAIPEYVRSKMERDGYRVEGGRKVVEVALQDGRKVAVPVDTVSYHYVGQRIH
jgi:hypothetical protein